MRRRCVLKKKSSGLSGGAPATEKQKKYLSFLQSELKKLGLNHKSIDPSIATVSMAAMEIGRIKKMIDRNGEDLPCEYMGSTDIVYFFDLTSEDGGFEEADALDLPWVSPGVALSRGVSGLPVVCEVF